MRPSRLAWFTVLACVAWATPAAAQGGSGPGLRAFVSFDRLSMTASQSFDAVIDAHTFTARGGGVEVTRLLGGAFARVAFARVKADGERAVVVGGQAVRLGVPLRVEMTPIEVGGGWRQRLDRRGRLVGYGGAGALIVTYRETSSFAGPADNVDERFNGWAVFGGVDVDLWRGVMAGVEYQYRRVANALGEGGVSQSYGETDLGGSVVRVVFGYRR
jgi:opacity protein-like surface antigen